MEEGVTNNEDYQKEITAENEGEVVIHIDITENEHKTNQDTFDKVIEGFLDDTSSFEMEEVVNNEEYHEQNITAENKDEIVIHRDITQNEHKNNRDNFDKITEEFTEDTSPVDMEEYVNDKNYYDSGENDEGKEEN